MIKKLIALIALGLIAFGFFYPMYQPIEIPEDENPIEEIVTNLEGGSRSVVKITHNLSLENILINKQGSGVIIGSDDVYYYMVTNHHLMTKDGYISQSIVIEDYLGNEYQGQNIVTNQALEIVSISYDLSMIRFSKNLEQPLSIVVIRTSALTVNEMLYAVGYPNGIRQVTIGNAESIRAVNGYAIELLEHSAEIAHGNSGGALLDSTGKLVGINVAGIFDQGVFITGFSIPANKLVEYISLFNV